VSTDYMLDPPEDDPPCPVCGDPVEVDIDGGYHCENCGAEPNYWPDYGQMHKDREEGEW